MRRWVGAVFGALVVPSLVFAGGADLSAVVTRTADRGAQFQATPTVPVSTICQRVIVIGDSLMDNSEPWLRSELRDRGYEYFVDAQPSRRIPGYVRAPYSGVKAALAARASWGEADCWMIALGSNDLVRGGGDPTAAASMIDEMLGSITPGAAVWWVNVDYHRDSRTSFDFVGATQTFNTAVDSLVTVRPKFFVIDWYSYAEANSGWFFDPVHVNREGSIARASFVVDALWPAG